jgi:hypothetical protein
MRPAIPALWQPDNQTFATGPVRADGTSLAIRIVDAFLMRASQDWLGHGNRTHLMVLKKQGNFLEYCGIVPDVATPGNHLRNATGSAPDATMTATATLPSDNTSAVLVVHQLPATTL